MADLKAMREYADKQRAATLKVAIMDVETFDALLDCAEALEDVAAMIKCRNDGERHIGGGTYIDCECSICKSRAALAKLKEAP